MSLILNSTAVPLFGGEGEEPNSHLVIEFQNGDAEGITRMILSMVSAQEVHDRNYRAGIDRNTTLALEGLAEAIKLRFHEDSLATAGTDIIGDIIAFHERFDLAYTGKPRSLKGVLDDVGQDLFNFRVGFDYEETQEYEDEQNGLSEAIVLGDHDGIVEGLHKQLDAILDGVYVKLGTGYLQFGADAMRQGWDRVQKANMAKVRATDVSQSKRGSLFDVVKPAGWVEPDHRDLVADHAYPTKDQSLPS